MTRFIQLLALLTLLWSTAPAVASAQAGFDTERLQRVDSVLQQHVDEGVIAGAVALVMRDGEIVYEQAVGWLDREERRPMTTDAIFRIASQSKAITSAAIMMLVEEGSVALRPWPERRDRSRPSWSGPSRAA